MIENFTKRTLKKRHDQVKTKNILTNKRTALLRVASVLAIQGVKGHVAIREHSGRNSRGFAANPLDDAGVADPKSKQLANKAGKCDNIGRNTGRNKLCKPRPKRVQKARR